MDEERSSGDPGLPPGVLAQSSGRYLPRAELTDYRLVAVQLRKALARTEARLRQRDELIHRQELLKAESDHRLLNDLQMTISLLTLQSRNSTSPEAASELAAAASSRFHDRPNPPSPQFPRWCENNRIQEIP
jgi:hypothetical protein